MTAWLNAVRNAKILPKGAPSYKHRRRLPEAGPDVEPEVEMARSNRRIVPRFSCA